MPALKSWYSFICPSELIGNFQKKLNSGEKWNKAVARKEYEVQEAFYFIFQDEQELSLFKYWWKETSQGGKVMVWNEKV